MQHSIVPPQAAVPHAAPEPRQIHPHSGVVTSALREDLLQQRATTVWLTGLSGAGKSTLAYEMEHRLIRRRSSCFVLDGDSLRHRLNRDLGFSPTDRRENVRRMAEVAALMNDAGLIVFVAVISPLREDRALARAIVGEHRFVEVHVCTSLEVCERRDPKGLYSKARAGLIPDFTGVSAPYEAPAAPDLRVDSGESKLEVAADALLELLIERGLVSQGPGATPLVGRA